MAIALVYFLGPGPPRRGHGPYIFFGHGAGLHCGFRRWSQGAMAPAMLRLWVYLKLSTQAQKLYGRYKITLPRWKWALTR